MIQAAPINFNSYNLDPINTLFYIKKIPILLKLIKSSFKIRDVTNWYKRLGIQQPFDLGLGFIVLFICTRFRYCLDCLFLIMFVIFCVHFLPQNLFQESIL